MSAFKVFFFSILLTISLAVLKPAFAQSSTPSATPNTTIINNYISQPNTDNLVIQLTHTLSCLAEGRAIDGKPCFEEVDKQLSSSFSTPINSPQFGAIGLTQVTMLGLYTNAPINTGEYLSDLGKSLNLVKPAYAEVYGTGSQVARPVLNLWKITRNISYLAITIIFIIVGFMLMFNSKINPQTVISVQNALPGLIIGLILITFSYFLASLIIDLSFVTTNVVGAVLEGDGINGVIPKGQTQIILEKENVLSIFNSFATSSDNLHASFTGVAGQTINFINHGIVGTIIETALRFIGCQWGWTLGSRLVPGNTTALGTGPGTLPPIIAGAIGCAGGQQALYSSKHLILGLILYIVLIIALLIAMFRLLFNLVGTYISIIVLVVTGPFYFLIGSLPGRGGITSEWIKSMIGNVLVFPAVFIVFVFAAYLGSTPTSTAIANPGQQVQLAQGVFGRINGAGDFSTTFTMPLFGGFPVDLVRLMLAYGVLLALPIVPDQVRKMLGVKGMEAFAQAALGGFNEGIGGAQDVRTWARGRAAGLYSQPAVAGRVTQLKNVKIGRFAPFNLLPNP